MSESEELYKLLFNGARDGMWLINPVEHSVVDANQSLVTLTGYTKEELLSMQPQNISPDPEGTVQIMKNALQPGGEIFMERAVKRKDGKIIPVEISARPMKTRNQTYIIGIFRDIRDRKKMDEEKENLIRELESALKEVKSLSGLLPICSSCKKIRDDKGYWNRLEEYIQKHSSAQFSHGICPDCCDRLYGKEEWYIKPRKIE